MKITTKIGEYARNILKEIKDLKQPEYAVDLAHPDMMISNYGSNNYREDYVRGGNYDNEEEEYEDEDDEYYDEEGTYHLYSVYFPSNILYLKFRRV